MEKAMMPALMIGLLLSQPTVTSELAHRRPPPKIAPVPILVGKASWYGAEWDGRRTASGERFNHRAATCACNRLPMGTVIRVVCNGHEAIMRVTDRGGFGRYGRILDVSEQMAYDLGFHDAGVAEVAIYLFR